MSIQQEKFKEIADAIREKTNSTGKIKPSEFAGKVDEVYEAGKTKGIEEGKQAEQDRFWDVYQKSGQPMTLTQLFAYDAWTDAIYKPKYTLRSSATSISYTYYSSLITDTIVDIDATDKTLVDTFSYAGQLVTVRKLIVSENTKYTTPFRGTGRLVNLTIEGVIGQDGFDVSPCTKLTHDSLMSILNAGRNCTLNLGTANLEKLSIEEKAAAIEKGCTLI